MSIKIYPLFYLLFLFSCSGYQYYTAFQPIKSLTDIPLKQSTDNIDCYFNNETPDIPYYKVKMVEITGTQNASYDELLISLKDKARKEGLDAVIILGKQQETVYDNLSEKINVGDTSVDYYRQLARPYQKLSAIGIKYVKNINYLDTIVKSTSFYFNKGSNLDSSVVNFDFYGNKTGSSNKLMSDYYTDSIEPFDLDKHLRRHVKQWQYKMDDLNQNDLMAFRKVFDQLILVHARKCPNEKNKFDYAITKTSPYKIKKYELKFEKDNLNRITRKTLKNKKNIIWIEDIFYDKNFTTGFKRYKMNDNKEEIIFTATNQYFSVNDLPNTFQKN